MITLAELNPRNHPLSEEQKANLPILHERINRLRNIWGKPMIVTSGVRSVEHHKRIYLEKAKRTGITNPRIPMGSNHLKGAAVDISDPDGSLLRWLKANEPLLEELKLWVEDGTRGWAHVQIFPPRSGRRFFMP